MINLEDDGIFKNPPTQKNMDLGLKYLPKKVREQEFVLQPEYQRDVVWSDEEMGLFVGFLLEGGETQNLLWNDRGLPDGYAVVDGQQRMMSCLRFMENDIPALAHDNHGNTVSFSYDELDEDSRNLIAVNIRLPIGIMSIPKEQEPDVYLDVNARGKEHTDDELQKARDVKKQYQSSPDETGSMYQ